MKSRSTAARLLAVSAIATFAGTWSAATAPAHAASGKQLIGTFRISAGSCAHGTASGSYLQMILPSGNASGPFMSNSDSSCSNQAYTLLSAGTDGGLVTGEYQSAPKPAFDAHGNAIARRITATAQYEGTAFATSTEPVDPQTNRKVPVPTISDEGGRLSGDLRSFGVTWNKQYFNQGSPKPDGTYPGSSKPVSGTYDAATGNYTLTWISQVVGGPFDKFSCEWHLSGQFVPAASSSGGTTKHGGGHSTTTSGGSHNGSTSGSTTSTSTGGSTDSSGVTSNQGSATGSSSHVPASGSKGTSAAGSGAAAPQIATTQAASTSTVSRQSWHASWWLIAIAIAIAVLGFAAVGALNRRLNRGTQTPTPAVSP